MGFTEIVHPRDRARAEVGTPSWEGVPHELRALWLDALEVGDYALVISEHDGSGTPDHHGRWVVVDGVRTHAVHVAPSVTSAFGIASAGWFERSHGLVVRDDGRPAPPCQPAEAVDRVLIPGRPPVAGVIVGVLGVPLSRSVHRPRHLYLAAQLRTPPPSHPRQ